MEHLSERDLERFWRDQLEPAEVRRVVRHLVSGCDRCEASLLLAAPREIPFWERDRPPEDAYDRAIDRAWRKARKLLPRILEDRRRRELGLQLLRKVNGDWTKLTWPEERSFKGLWPHVEILLQRSFDCRYSDPQEMLSLAKFAQECADRMEAECQNKGIHREAMTALIALETLSQFKVATPRRVEHVRDFLYRVREFPGLRLELTAAILA